MKAAAGLSLAIFSVLPAFEQQGFPVCALGAGTSPLCLRRKSPLFKSVVGNYPKNYLGNSFPMENYNKDTKEIVVG